MTTITGGCLYKAVRYTVTAAPMVTRQCWCRECQYLGGGSTTVNVCFPSNAMTVTGATTTFSSIAASGNRMLRQFCPTCGTPLFSAAESRPHLIFARVGTLDDPELVKPDMTIWVKSAPKWACIDTTIPMVDGQPPPAA